LKDVPKDNLVLIPGTSVAFIKGVNHREARELEGRTVHPNTLQKLFLEKNDIVAPLLWNHGAYFAVVFASEKPMEQYIKNGNLYVEANYNNETRELTTSVDHLIKAGIDKTAFAKGNKILYIFDDYNVDDSKSERVSFTVVDAYGDSAALRDWLKGDGWGEADGGLASTKKVSSPQFKDVYNIEYISNEGNILGSGRRGYGLRRGFDERGLHVGGWSDGRRGVFKEIAGTSLDLGGETTKPQSNAPAIIASVPSDVKELLLKQVSELETNFTAALSKIRQQIENL